MERGHYERGEYSYDGRHGNSDRDSESASDSFPSVKALMNRFKSSDDKNEYQREGYNNHISMDKRHGDYRKPGMIDQQRQLNQGGGNDVREWFGRRDESQNWPQQQNRSDQIVSYSEESVSNFARLGIRDRDSVSSSRDEDIKAEYQDRYNSDRSPDHRAKIQYPARAGDRDISVQDHSHRDEDMEPAVCREFGYGDVRAQAWSGQQQIQDRIYRYNDKYEPHTINNFNNRNMPYEKDQRIEMDERKSNSFSYYDKYDHRGNECSPDPYEQSHQSREAPQKSSEYCGTARESGPRPFKDGRSQDGPVYRNDDRVSISRNEYESKASRNLNSRPDNNDNQGNQAALENRERYPRQRNIKVYDEKSRVRKSDEPPTRDVDNSVCDYDSTAPTSVRGYMSEIPRRNDNNCHTGENSVWKRGTGNDEQDTIEPAKCSVSDHSIHRDDIVNNKQRSHSSEDKNRKLNISRVDGKSNQTNAIVNMQETKQGSLPSEITKAVSGDNELVTRNGDMDASKISTSKYDKVAISDKKKQKIEERKERLSLHYGADLALAEILIKSHERKVGDNKHDGSEEPERSKQTAEAPAVDEDNLESASHLPSASTSTLDGDCNSEMLASPQKNQNARTRDTSHSTLTDCQVDFGDGCCEPCSGNYWYPNMGAKDGVTSNDRTGHFTQMGSYMRNLHQNQQLLDVKIVIGDQTFMAHRIALSCHSDYFADLFSKQCVAKRKYPLEIHVKGVTALAFRVFLEYVYTGQIRAPPQEGALCEMMMAAEKLLIPYMRDKCEEFASDASPEEALLLLKRSQRTSRMFQIVYDIVVSNMQDLLCSKTFVQLDLETVSDLLSDSQLIISSEVLVFGLAVRWMEYAKCERYKYGPRLLECVRLSLMNNKELFHCSESSPVFLDYPICMDKLLRANWIATCRNLKVPDPMMLPKATARRECVGCSGVSQCASISGRKSPESVYLPAKQNSTEEVYPCPCGESTSRGPYSRASGASQY